MSIISVNNKMTADRLELKKTCAYEEEYKLHLTPHESMIYILNAVITQLVGLAYCPYNILSQFTENSNAVLKLSLFRDLVQHI